jgi:hypothetical protein
VHQTQAVRILNAAAFTLPRRLRRIAQVDAAATGEGAVGAGLRRQQPAAIGGDQADGPVLALVLGAAGLLPTVAALLVMLFAGRAYQDIAFRAAGTYGAVILSFLGITLSQ